MLPLADFTLSMGSGALLFAWMLATIILSLLGWVAFTIRQRQYRNDLDD